MLYPFISVPHHISYRHILNRYFPNNTILLFYEYKAAFLDTPSTSLSTGKSMNTPNTIIPVTRTSDHRLILSNRRFAQRLPNFEKPSNIVRQIQCEQVGYRRFIYGIYLNPFFQEPLLYLSRRLHGSNIAVGKPHSFFEKSSRIFFYSLNHAFRSFDINRNPPVIYLLIENPHIVLLMFIKMRKSLINIKFSSNVLTAVFNHSTEVVFIFVPIKILVILKIRYSSNFKNTHRLLIHIFYKIGIFWIYLFTLCNNR